MTSPRTTAAPLAFITGVLLLLLAAPALSAQPLPTVPAPARAPLVIFNGPLWDISSEGLPFSLTLAWPAAPDPVARWLCADETRWTAGLGYAVVRDNLDRGTNRVFDRGGDGLLFNAGRQTLWRLPLRLPAGALRAEFELGLNYATASLPANGSHLSFALTGGFEWSNAPRAANEWIAGLRWLHLSHGGLFGVNGGYDGLVFRLGRRWTF